MKKKETSLSKAEAVLSANDNSKNGLKIFLLSGKTPAAPRQVRDIMPQASSVDACVTFVMGIEDVLSWKELSALTTWHTICYSSPLTIVTI